MKCFFVFAPMFYELPLAIAREFKKQVPSSSFCGLSTGSREVFDGVCAAHDLNISPFDWLDDLERQWIKTDATQKKLEEYEEVLGVDTIKRLVIADRQIGTGYVTGIIKRETSIIKLTCDHDKLRNYVVGLLDYLFDRLSSEKPDFVFCYTVAGAPAFALSVVCQNLGIPFFRISSARMKSRFIIDSSTDVTFKMAHELFKKSLSSPEVVSNYIEEARDYINEFRNKPKKYDASYKIHAKHIKQHSIKGMIKQSLLDLRMIMIASIKRPNIELRKPNAYEMSIERFMVNYNARKISGSGIFDVKLGDLKRPFIYFPLHVNPEASTMVQSPMHTNQLSIIESISKSAPLSMDIIIKEHIPMLGKRPIEFYEKLKSMPGVKLASPYEDSFEFIKQAKLVCSITSTVAWEAIMLRRPTIIIGNPFFLGIGQGICHCPDLSSLPNIINDAFKLDSVDEKRLELYIASILATSFDMPIEIYVAGATEKLVRKNHGTVEKICEAILSLMNQQSLNTN
jgi:capsular polysaccharide biosynthesis protein